MPFMYTCTYCGKEQPTMARWEKQVIGHRASYSVRVCESAQCQVKAQKAGFERDRKAL